MTMIDYYLGFTTQPEFSCEWGKWNEKLRSMAIGDSLKVDTEDDRCMLLQTGNRIGCRVATKKLKSGGYVIVRIDGPPRRRGKPKIRL